MHGTEYIPFSPTVFGDLLSHSFGKELIPFQVLWPPITNEGVTYGSVGLSGIHLDGC